MSLPPSLFVHHHLGLGDHIVCNAIVRKLFNRFGSLILAVKHHNLSSVKQLYRDIDIEYYPVSSDSDCIPMYKDNKYIRIGFENCILTNWEKSFYDQMGIDYSERFSGFFISRDFDRERQLEKKLNLPKEFAFCNFSCSSGSFDTKVNTNLKKITPSPITDSIFDWIGVLSKAKEIHTLDSSFFHLVKQLDLKCDKFLYDSQSLDSTRQPFTLDNQSWKVIDL